MMRNFTHEYPRLAHALQSGVAETFRLDAKDIADGKCTASSVATSPKMLRTGVNVAMVEQSALAAILIRKGVMTQQEYEQGLLVALDAEVARYQKELSERLGVTVTLG